MTDRAPMSNDPTAEWAALKAFADTAHLFNTTSGSGPEPEAGAPQQDAAPS